MDRSADITKKSAPTFLPVLTWARTHLIINYPFFGLLALYLPIRLDLDVQTALTDGRYVTVNPSWIDGVVRREGREVIAGLIAHEVMHMALQHLWRRGTRVVKVWNNACDYAVNSILAGAGIKLPAGALLNYEYSGLTAEEIYSRLHKKSDRASPPQPWGEHQHWDEAEKDPVEAAEQQREWEMRIARAAESARQTGKLPGGLERLVREWLYPRIDWRQALAVFLQPTRLDYTFIPPDRRYLSQEYDGMVMPDFGQVGLEEVVIAVDTSGSVSGMELDAFLGEAASILETFPEMRGIMVSCDAAVAGWHEVEPGEAWPSPRMIGGGGTDFRPVFDEIERRDVHPAAVVFLTDGAGQFPAEPPPYPVLWVIVNNHRLEVPFGLKIDLEVKE